MRFNVRFSMVTALIMAAVLSVFFGPHCVVAAHLALAHIADPSGLGVGLAGIGFAIGDIAPFPTRPELLAVKMAYKNPLLISDLVLPRIPVNKMKFEYIYFDKGDTFRVPETLIGRRGAPNKVELFAHSTIDQCLAYGLDYDIPQDDIDEAPQNYDPLAVATAAISNWVALDREVRVAATVFAAATYDSDHKTTLSGNDQWDKFAQANADPVEDITTALDACLMRPTHMAIGRLAYSKLARNPNIIKSVSNITGVGIASKRAIADLFELQDIYVGESFVNSGKKGQSATMSRTWGKHCLLFYKDPAFNNVAEGITFGYTATNKQFAGAMPDTNIGPRGGQKVRAGEYVCEHIMAADLGYFIENAVA